MRIVAVFFVVIMLGTLFVASAFARDQRSVLGDATSTKDLSTVSMEPTVEGPGIILPDSPLFFLDILKQQVRLLLTLSSQERAKIHSAVAGERMAELRFMLAKNNEKGVDIALDGIADNFKEAGKDLSSAKMHGADVAELARRINDDVKVKQLVLDSLSTQTNAAMHERINSVNTSLFSAKMHIEDSLKKEDLGNEIVDDMDWYLSHEVNKTTAAATNIEAQLAELEREATEAGQKDLTARENAVKEAIKQKNKEKILSEQKKLQDMQIDHDKSLQLHKEAVAAVAKTIQNAKETQEKMDALQKSQKELTRSSETTVK